VLARALVVLAASVAGASAQAQLWVPDKGAGAVSVDYQYTVDHTHLFGNGDEFDPGFMPGHTLQLRVDYGLTDRLAMYVSVPFVSRKYEGDDPHDPTVFNLNGAHQTFLDDGNWHGGWQDPGVGLRLRWRTPTPGHPWAVTPFARYEWPSHDYTYFAHSAIGSQQSRFALGAAAGRHFGPRFQNLFFQGTYAYTFVEEVLGISVDYSSLDLELGWHFTPRFSARALVLTRKTHGGLDGPQDFPSFTDERFLHHDQVSRTDYVDWGVAATWNVGRRYTLTANWITTAWGENTHKIHNSVGLGISRSFD
jgi:hypothetical protein